MIDLIKYLNTIPWVLSGIFFILIILLISLSEYSYRRNISKPNINRKIIHFIVGLAVSLSPYIFLSNIQPIIIAIIFLIINFVSYKKNNLKSFHDLNRKTLGTIFFPLAFIFISTFFWEYKSGIACSFMILSISDPLSSLIGESIKKPHKYIIKTDLKSYEGSVIMFLSTFIILSLFSNSIFNQSNFIQSLIAIIICSIAITIAEAMSIKGSDNLSIPILAFFFIELFNSIGEQNLIIEFSLIMTIITISLFYFHKKNHLSSSGFLSSFIMAMLVLGFGNIKYLIPITLFFTTSTFLSKLGPEHSHKLKSGRTAYQVLANGGIGLILCVTNHFYQTELIFYMFLSSVAAANSDTWATEIGKLSKTKPKDILTGRDLLKGESGGVTLIGLLGSICGSLIIAMFAFFLEIKPLYFLLIFISGFFGSLFDSFIGSALQSRFILIDGKTIIEKRNENSFLYSGISLINNDTVNLACTLSAPIFFFLLYRLM